jgi:hypothetical protein
MGLEQGLAELESDRIIGSHTPLQQGGLARLTLLNFSDAASTRS